MWTTGHAIALNDPEMLLYFKAVDAMHKSLAPTVGSLEGFARARKVMLESRIDRELPVKVANDYPGGSGGNTSRYASSRSFKGARTLESDNRVVCECSSIHAQAPSEISTYSLAISSSTLKRSALRCRLPCCHLAVHVTPILKRVPVPPCMF